MNNLIESVISRRGKILGWLSVLLEDNGFGGDTTGEETPFSSLRGMLTHILLSNGNTQWKVVIEVYFQGIECMTEVNTAKRLCRSEVFKIHQMNQLSV